MGHASYCFAELHLEKFPPEKINQNLWPPHLLADVDVNPFVTKFLLKAIFGRRDAYNLEGQLVSRKAWFVGRALLSFARQNYPRLEGLNTERRFYSIRLNQIHTHNLKLIKGLNMNYIILCMNFTQIGVSLPLHVPPSHIRVQKKNDCFDAHSVFVWFCAERY